MAIYRLQVEYGADTALPRDKFTITPHFSVSGALQDPQALCDDLAAALSTKPGSFSREVTVKAYDAQGTPPVYPVGEATVNASMNPVGTCPREVALCLSFYSQRNVPRQRGRLYIPAQILEASADVGLRPRTLQMESARDFSGIFSALGGPNVDWVVFSRADNVGRPVTNCWVDDEWDTVRSRGLRATQRLTATVAEG